MDKIKEYIESGKASLGIELGSSRIKAVLIGEDYNPIADGGFAWENSLIDGIWTYSIEEVWKGVAECYKELKNNVMDKYGVKLTKFNAIGFSAMMHGYLAFDKNGKLLTPFRTWRNNITEKASEELSELFDYPIPQRWSIAHLYQSILNNEQHVKDLDFFTTLSGYVHWKLTGKKVIGVGDASGMFPISADTQNFNTIMLKKFNKAVEDNGYNWKLENLLPEVLVAGKEAGKLTEEGAILLDPSGDLSAGIPFCPPEGDAGTGMVATNSVKKRTGNVSAGTSVFAMIVLENELTKRHSELDLVTTPDGSAVAMAHSNNCTGEYDKWVTLFKEVADASGAKVSKSDLFGILFNKALNASPDCGGLLCYGYLSGEHITGFAEGRPMVVRRPEAELTLGNFMRAQLFTALCAMRTGLNVLFDDEKVEVDVINGHGGFFKTPEVSGPIMAAAVNTKVNILETAGEGGAWGMALLAGYLGNKKELSEYLDTEVFKNSSTVSFKPQKKDLEGFDQFFTRYTKGLPIERAAVENI
ncbi:MAG: FGGY-family carbohydrate kinase [Spirochaetales bacterium]|nr:FGGY-family carbohydrate kinase [Spirochaetales bacterium]